MVCLSCKLCGTGCQDRDVVTVPLPEPGNLAAYSYTCVCCHGVLGSVLSEYHFSWTLLLRVGSLMLWVLYSRFERVAAWWHLLVTLFVSTRFILQFGTRVLVFALLVTVVLFPRRDFGAPGVLVVASLYRFGVGRDILLAPWVTPRLGILLVVLLHARSPGSTWTFRTWSRGRRYRQAILHGMFGASGFLNLPTFLLPSPLLQDTLSSLKLYFEWFVWWRPCAWAWPRCSQFGSSGYSIFWWDVTSEMFDVDE